MKIPIAKPYLTEKEAKAAYDAVLSGWVTQGPKVEEFEKNFAEYVGSKYAVALSNCTTALHLSLLCAGIEENDEVICPSMSYIATANAIIHASATPIFAEVNDDYNLDIEDVKLKITPKTKAILLVHQIGNPADIDAFTKLCNEKNIILIEDAACAIGSEYKGKKIGLHSELVCFSFHPRKVITTGDGGMITTNNEAYYNWLKLLRQHGMSVNDRERHQSNKIILEEYLEVGYNYRMTDIQASVGIEQLKKLDMLVSERRNIAQNYNKAFQNSPNIQFYDEKEGFKTNYQSYSIILKNIKKTREEIMQNLLDKGISTRRGIMLIHKEKAYSNYSINLPKSEFYSQNSLLLPIYYGLTTQEVDYVIESVLNELK